MTYRSFCDSSKLLSLLIERFHIPQLYDADIIARNKFIEQYILPIRLRYCQVGLKVQQIVDYPNNFCAPL